MTSQALYDPHRLTYRRWWSRSLVGVAVAAAVAGAVVPAPAVAAGGGAGDAIAGAVQIAGRIAFVTGDGKVEVATVTAAGKLTGRHAVGPVTVNKPGGTDVISNLVASRDGRWLAWEETWTYPGKPGSGGPTLKGATVVIRHLTVKHATPGHGLTTLPVQHSDYSPLGFAGDTLVVDREQSVGRVTTGSSPTVTATALPSLTDTVLGVVPHGVIIVAQPPHSLRQLVQKLSFSGHRTTLHNFPKPNEHKEQAPIESGWVSPDSRRLVVEHGDHTDFGGVGPSSRADVLSPRHPSTPRHLGHPGPASAQRRMEQTSFSGQANVPYTVWMSAKTSAPKASVYAYRHGAWHLVEKNSVVVAGGPGRFVAVQPGRYVADSEYDAPVYFVSPKGHAVLIGSGHRHVLPFSATAMVWLDQ